MHKETYYTINLILLLAAFWCVVWASYKLFVEPTNPFMNKELIDIPVSVSCAIPAPTTYAGKSCDATKIDRWTLGHIAIYASIGLLVPHIWAIIIVFSIMFESFEYFANLNAKWLLDPLTNITGYALGHVAYIDLHKWSWLSQFNPLLTVICGILVIVSVSAIKIYRSDETTTSAPA